MSDTDALFYKTARRFALIDRLITADYGGVLVKGATRRRGIRFEAYGGSIAETMHRAAWIAYRIDDAAPHPDLAPGYYWALPHKMGWWMPVRIIRIEVTGEFLVEVIGEAGRRPVADFSIFQPIVRPMAAAAWPDPAGGVYVFP